MIDLKNLVIDLKQRVKRIQESFEKEIPIVLALPTGETKMAKKVTKKAAKKVVKKAAKPSVDGLITIAQLAEEAGITAQRARQKLREAELDREGRWKFEANSKSLQGARKALGL